MAQDYLLVHGDRVPLAPLLAFVRRIAYRLARILPPHVSVDDLISAGFEGLLDAAEKYDPARVDHFEQYAEYRIRGAILDALRDLDPLGRDMRHAASSMSDAVSELTNRLTRPPTDEEIIAELGWSSEQYNERRLLFTQAVTLSLDELMAEDATATATGQDGKQDEVAELLDALETAGLIDRALRCLSVRHEQVVRLHYFQGLMLREIGERMGFTESRACQIEAEALRALRKIFTDLRAGKEALHEPRPSSVSSAPATDGPLALELAATAAALDALLDDPPVPSRNRSRRGKAS